MKNRDISYHIRQIIPLKKIWKGFLLFLFPLIVLSQEQELHRVIPPSPNVAAFNKYGDIPVSPYTGVPNISVPLYTINSKDISVPISLSYHASGIRVAEEASRVGLGFTLNSGGIISRTVMGRDDFSVDDSYHKGNVPELPYGPIDEPIANIQDLHCKLSFISGDLDIPEHYFDMTDISHDFEPDQYSYNFLGYSGKFILTPNKEVILGKKEKIEIRCLDDDANAWEIRTSDGMIYSFNVYESYLDLQDIVPPVKSAWYLTKIKSPTGEEVNFHYSTINNWNIKPIGTFVERRYTFSVKGNRSDGVVTPPPFSEMAPSKDYVNVQLDSIDFNNGRVKLIYGSRDDIEKDSKIESVKVFKKVNGNIAANPFKEFQFNYDYFVSNFGAKFDVENPFTFKRLKLLSLQEKSINLEEVVTKPPYRFRYYEEIPLPAKSSFARDHWGYYNGKGGNNSLVPSFNSIGNTTNPVDHAIGIRGKERDAIPSYIKAYSLKEIIYPTGGSTEFQYEAHDYDPKLSKLRDQSYFGHNRPLTYTKRKRMYYNGKNRGVIYEQELDLRDMAVDGNGNYPKTKLRAFFRVSNECSSISDTPNIYFELYRSNGNRISGVSFETPRCTDNSNDQCLSCDGVEFNYTNEYSLQPDVYLWKAYMADDYATAEFQDIHANYTYEAEYGSLYSNDQKFSYAGGLRISKIIDKDNVNDANNKIKHYKYHYKEDKNKDGIEEEYSHGLLMIHPRYSYFESVNEGPRNNGFLLVRASNSTTPLTSSASGNTIGYSQVSVLYGNDGIYGKTIYTYENKSDKVYNYSLTVGELLGKSTPFMPPSKPSLGYEKNGLLLTKTHYRKQDSNFIKVSELFNQYNSVFYNINNSNLYYYGVVLRKHVSSNVASKHCGTAYLYPAIQSNLVNLTKTTERTYDQNNVANFLETNIDYKYDHLKQIQLTETIITTSDGKTVSTKTLYPDDIKTNVTLQDDSILNGGELTATTFNAINKMKEGALHQVATPIQIETTVKDINNNLLSQFIQRTNFSEPFTNLVLPKSVQTLKGIYNASTNKSEEKIEYTYYSNGNVKQVNKVNGTHIIYIWGYQNQHPIAKIENATYSDIEDYISNLQTTSNQDNDRTQGYLGKEGALRQALDNLRNTLPSTTMVSTYTYDPLIGVTSMTDPKGYTMYYEYDELNRLKEVRDHEGNLINDYHYHYKNNQ